MKINEALARIDAGWVRKPKGFRVRFDVYVDGCWEADFSPEENAAPLDSDVIAWRLAWKLAQANDGSLANLHAVLLMRDGDLLSTEQYNRAFTGHGVAGRRQRAHVARSGHDRTLAVRAPDHAAVPSTIAMKATNNTEKRRSSESPAPGSSSSGKISAQCTVNIAAATSA